MVLSQIRLRVEREKRGKTVFSTALLLYLSAEKVFSPHALTGDGTTPEGRGGEESTSSSALLCVRVRRDQRLKGELALTSL